MTHRHVLSVTVRDRPGVLLRIASLFARRGYNIESLSVAQTDKPGLSRTTFVVTGEERTVEQVEKQLTRNRSDPPRPPRTLRGAVRRMRFARLGRSGGCHRGSGLIRMFR